MMVHASHKVKAETSIRWIGYFYVFYTTSISASSRGTPHVFIWGFPAVSAGKFDSNGILGTFWGTASHCSSRLQSQFIAAHADVSPNQQRFPQLETHARFRYVERPGQGGFVGSATVLPADADRRRKGFPGVSPLVSPYHATPERSAKAPESLTTVTVSSCNTRNRQVH